MHPSFHIFASASEPNVEVTRRWGRHRLSLIVL